MLKYSPNSLDDLNITDNMKFYALLTLTGVIIFIGTVFYHYVEEFAWVDAYYFSVIALTTVGFGDFSPVTTIGKIFTTIYILVGIGILVAFVSIFADRMINNQAIRKEIRHLENLDKKLQQNKEKEGE